MIISIPVRQNQYIFVNAQAIDYVISGEGEAWVIRFRGGAVLPLTDPLMTIGEFVTRWREALSGSDA